jgi:hypothetical protein
MVRAATALAMLASLACADNADRSRTDSLAPVDSAAPAMRPPVTLSFDPAAVKVGDTVGGLRVSKADISKATGDMGYVGDVQFDGEITISGERMTHPDFPEVKAICMRMDSASVARLPRFPEDQRRSWLCFENQDAAARMVGAAGTRGLLTVVIDRYQTVRHFSDAYDTAVLVRLVEDKREP